MIVVHHHSPVHDIVVIIVIPCRYKRRWTVTSWNSLVHTSNNYCLLSTIESSWWSTQCVVIGGGMGGTMHVLRWHLWVWLFVYSLKADWPVSGSYVVSGQAGQHPIFLNVEWLNWCGLGTCTRPRPYIALWLACRLVCLQGGLHKLNYDTHKLLTNSSTVLCALYIYFSRTWTNGIPPLPIVISSMSGITAQSSRKFIDPFDRCIYMSYRFYRRGGISVGIQSYYPFLKWQSMQP